MAFVAVLGVGCGEDEFSDEAYGAIDLAPYFFDGSSAANPTAGLPRDISGTKGWLSGVRAQFYDFGLVNFTRKRSATGATLQEPDSARANPIYLFYTSSGLPMFSKPIYDERTGTFHIRGGKDMLNPNPRTPKEGLEKERAFLLPYSARARDTVFDDARRSDDYQRPIIDALHNSTAYSGLWEIHEVIVQDGGYEPDSIKSAKTLLAARDGGKVQINKTGRVINCPVLDDRTWVTPSNMAFRTKPEPFLMVQPRIELWFRTKLGSCFLANGWETIGETKRGNDGQEDPRVLDDSRRPVNVDLFQAESLGRENRERVDTFDVTRFNVGDAKRPVAQVVVPVGKHYIPKVTVSRNGPTSDLRYVGDDLQVAEPRHFNYQQGGYSPLVWLHDITVPQDPPFQGGTFKTLDSADPMRVTARDSATTVWVKNFPVAGVASPCLADGDVDCAKGPFGLTCNRFPDFDLIAAALPAGKNIADVTVDREGGPRCDVKKVGFGEYCAPGVARCDTHTENPSPDWALLNANPPAADAVKDKDRKLFAAGGPAFAFPAVPAPVMDPMTMAVTNQAAIDKAKADQEAYKRKGYHKSHSPRGYVCHPSTGGYCYVRCDASVAAGNLRDIYKKDASKTPAVEYGTGAADNVALNERITRVLPVGATTLKWVPEYDARCGGTAMLGYQCVSNRPNAQRVCLRTCTTRNTDAQNAAICGHRFNDDKSDPDGGPRFQGAIQFHTNAGPADDLPGQRCVALQGATSCHWNPDFEPRGDDTKWPRP